MLRWLAARIARRYKAVLVVSVVFLFAGAGTAIGLGDALGVGGFYASSDESTRTDGAFDGRLPSGPHNLVVAARAADGGALDSPAATAAGIELTELLQQEEGVSSVVSYWPSAEPALRSEDGQIALVLARIEGLEDQRKETLLRIFPSIDGEHGGLELTPGGQPAVEREATARSEEDLRRMELLATPVVALILLFVFGSVVASLLPLVIGLTAIVGALVTLRVVATFTDVSIYSLNIATALSLGLAIDYGLFIVTRYREELDTGVEVKTAVATAMATAGRTVLFSALTVAVSLSSLLVFPLYFLRSFAYAGVAVVAFAAVSAVVVLPAVLMLLGRRIDRWDVVRGAAAIGPGYGRHRRLSLRQRLALRLGRAPRPRQRPDAVVGGRLSRSGSGRWHTLALFVMRRPVPLALGAASLLVVLGLPFLGVRYALTDATNLPADSGTSQVVNLLREDFGHLPTDAMYIVSPEKRLTPEETTAYAAAVSDVDGVTLVQASTGAFANGAQVAAPTPQSAAFDGPEASWLNVGIEGDPQGEEALATVAAVRSLDPPAPLLVGGIAAHLVDTQATLAEALPLAVAIVALASLVLLFLFTGSVLIPIKALLLNTLSLTATFGAAVWIFQEGHLRWLLGNFQTNGALELTTPILLFAIAFGLSMDYELFLISRIKEEYGRLRDNTAAVAAGLEKTGRLVTYAALLFVIVMAAFATSDISVLKLIGVGLALAVFMDATLVRAILVPAVMRLAGTANWWAPRPLRALHNRFGLHEGSPVADAAQYAEAAAHERIDEPAHLEPPHLEIITPAPHGRHANVELPVGTVSPTMSGDLVDATSPSR